MLPQARESARRISVHARQGPVIPIDLMPRRTAARRAFSPTSHITQRDGGIGMRTRRAAAPPAPRRPRPHRTAPPRCSRGRPPLDDPGLASVPRALIARGLHAPGRHPGHRNPSLRPGGIRAPRPGFSLIPCTVTRDQVRRKGDRPPCSRHDTRGCQHHGNPKDPVGGMSG
jgi:hypothetical protein